MLKLEWSVELEVFAQRLADQCITDTSRLTDWCYDLENSSVGQSIGTIYGDAPGLSAPTLVDLWYMELLNINASYLPRYVPSSITPLQHLDFFTQLIWAESSLVGCGGVKYVETDMDSNEKRNRTVYRLICNFAPRGNVIGQGVYRAGVPCSRCPYGGHCDSEFEFLCSSKPRSIVTDKSEVTEEYTQNILSSDNLHNLAKITKGDKSTDLTEAFSIIDHQYNLTQDMITDNDTTFDILSHLFDFNSIHTSSIKQTTQPCKDVLPVDEFIELIKNKLSSDQSLKNLFILNSNASTDSSYTDRTVAAIVDQVYSTKETTTISKTTHEENVNSTLLADLVEAVIFRHNDRFSTNEDTSKHLEVDQNVSPIKIQAELAEIQENTDTGHYFFPEEEEKTLPETTETYDDLENSHISEISLEINDLKKYKVTKDFLEEILELDFMTESVTIDSLVSDNLNSTNIY